MKRVASITVRAEGLVLLGKRKDTGRWTLPSGHADEGETMIEAALRELFEETGLRVTIFELKEMGQKVAKNRDGEAIEVTGFEVRLKGKEETTNENDPDSEVSEWAWFKELPEMHSEGMKLWI